MSDPKTTPDLAATFAAVDQVMREMLEELAATRPLVGPLSVWFGPPGGAHAVVDGTGAVVAVWPVAQVLERARQIASGRN